MVSIVLASASPRRRALLSQLGVEFSVEATGADEIPHDGESAPAMVERLSRLKARAAQARHPDALVIAADTDVELDGTIFGKPRDAAEARAMLRALRGRPHLVYTGLSLAYREELVTEIVRTCVWMRDYDDAEIEAYVSSGDALDKAAAYGVQHRSFAPVARVEGCFANVMGLPLCRLYHALAARITLPAPSLDCINHPERDCSIERWLMAQNS